MKSLPLPWPRGPLAGGILTPWDTSGVGQLVTWTQRPPAHPGLWAWGESTSHEGSPLAQATRGASWRRSWCPGLEEVMGEGRVAGQGLLKVGRKCLGRGWHTWVGAPCWPSLGEEWKWGARALQVGERGPGARVWGWTCRGWALRDPEGRTGLQQRAQEALGRERGGCSGQAEGQLYLIRPDVPTQDGPVPHAPSLACSPTWRGPSSPQQSLTKSGRLRPERCPSGRRT